jgi:hypothetical protein
MLAFGDGIFMLFMIRGVGGLHWISHFNWGIFHSAEKLKTAPRHLLPNAGSG